MERIPQRINKGRKCEIEGSPHKGEVIIEVKQLVDDFGLMEMNKGRLCQYYQDCYANNIKCQYTERITKNT